MADKRDSSGKFAPGHGGGPGRPSRGVEQEYLTAAYQTCSLERWRAVIERAVEQAEEGDSRARQFLAQYLLGKPSPGRRYTEVIDSEAWLEQWGN